MDPEPSFFSADDGLQIAWYKWLPEEAPVAILQIAHGMAEHAARYNDFARFMAQNGIAVYANDHRGHGYTADRNGVHGDFGEQPGWQSVVNDMKTLSEIAKKDYPGIPLFLLGHSMGSFLSRAWVAQFGQNLNGVILSGTAGDPGFTATAGRWIAKKQMRKYGDDTPSPKLDKMSFGSFNKKIKNAKTNFDWLSVNQDNVERYINDPWCGFVCSSRFFYELLGGLKTIFKKENIAKTPVSLPMFFIAWTNDPVGNYGKGVKQSAELYRKAGVRNIETKLYPGKRHEILNENNNDVVYADILNWIKTSH